MVQREIFHSHQAHAHTHAHAHICTHVHGQHSPKAEGHGRHYFAIAASSSSICCLMSAFLRCASYYSMCGVAAGSEQPATWLPQHRYISTRAFAGEPSRMWLCMPTHAPSPFPHTHTATRNTSTRTTRTPPSTCMAYWGTSAPRLCVVCPFV